MAMFSFVFSFWVPKLKLDLLGIIPLIGQSALQHSILVYSGCRFLSKEEGKPTTSILCNKNGSGNWIAHCGYGKHERGISEQYKTFALFTSFSIVLCSFYLLLL